MKSGTLYVWGKGEHEKPKFDDYIDCSIPYPMIEDKIIVLVSCGTTHVMAIDDQSRLLGWGDGSYGCLGLGNTERRVSVVPISSFENKRVIDVSCGEKFTVVLAEVYNPDMVEDDH